VPLEGPLELIRASKVDWTLLQKLENNLSNETLIADEYNVCPLYGVFSLMDWNFEPSTGSLNFFESSM
jgi:hypothetical protein